MKKEAREQALSIFLAADGKMSNTDIAKKVGVNPLTVGKWKKAESWAAKLKEKTVIKEKKGEPRPPRKKAAHDQALKLYLESEGKLSNTALAREVGVSPASVASWKTNERWAEKVTKPKAPAAPAPARAAKPAKPSKPAKPVKPVKPLKPAVVPETETIEEMEIDLEELTSPDQINRLNRRIEELLGREYLSPEDLKTLAEAKEAVLGVVSAYIDIIERVSEE